MTRVRVPLRLVIQEELETEGRFHNSKRLSRQSSDRRPGLSSEGHSQDLEGQILAGVSTSDAVYSMDPGLD